jgi:PadR family transcriptional regulator PadR
LTAVLHTCKTAVEPPHPRVLTVSPKELLILDLLVREKVLYGLQLVDASKGQLKRGTVYVTLGRMEEKGFITSSLDEAPPRAGGLPRRLYTATAMGRRMFKAWSGGTKRLTVEFAR